MKEKTLEVRGLTVCIPTEKGVIRPVNDVSLEVPAGSIVGIVGESGCGKSMTARAVMGLLRSPAKVTGGSVFLCGREITSLPEKERRNLRGAEISMIFQEPMTSLNPVMKVGRQVDEVIRVHRQVPTAEARKMTIGNGVSINKDKITDIEYEISEKDIVDGKYILAQKGKKNYFIINII